MGRRPLRVSIAHQRIINQLVIHTRRIPAQIIVAPAIYIRGLRSALRMKQRELAKRCGLSRSYINLLEKGKKAAEIPALRRIFDALFCDLLILPLPYKRPGDVLADRRLEKRDERRLWD